MIKSRAVNNAPRDKDNQSVISIESSFNHDNAIDFDNNNQTVIPSCATTTTQVKTELTSPWIPYKKLLIHYCFFKKGIVLVKPKGIPLAIAEKNNSFSIKDREFFFSEKNSDLIHVPNSHKKYVDQAAHLLSKLTKFSEKQTNIASSFINNNNTVVFNTKHREEAFLPLHLHANKQQIGVYVYPWLPKYQNNFEFSGFSQFVMAGCLFGHGLKGIDQLGGTFPALLKHDIKFFPNQKVEYILYDLEELSPYEAMLFSELKKLMHLIDIFSKPNQPKRLLYHLPYYDYVLFGVELFIRGRITLTALEMLFNAIFEKKEEHIKKITTICEHHNVEVEIQSPFENIFGSLNINNDLTKTILNLLQLSIKEVSPDISIEQQKKNEEALVKYCINLLQNNNFDEKHRRVWQNLENTACQNLEELFKRANAAMIALAAMDKSDYETCSLLPLSEKQIQVTYCKVFNRNKNNNNSTRETIYPAVFNLTALDPLVTYSPTTEGLPFYFGYSKKALSKLITDKGILSYAYSNAGLFANKSASNVLLDTSEEFISLEQVLQGQVTP